MVELAVERPHAGGDREQVEVVQNLVRVDVRERRPLPAAGLVRVTVAALRALADHQVRLGVRRPAGEQHEERRRR
jgi:hypothetical protein